MFPITTHGQQRASNKIQFLKMLVHASAALILWSQFLIWPLHTDYFKALIIHQGRREAKRVREKVWLLSVTLSLTHPPTYILMAQGHFSYMSIKQYIISLRVKTYDWCARHLLGLYCKPSKKCLNTMSSFEKWQVSFTDPARHLHLYLLSYQKLSNCLC